MTDSIVERLRKVITLYDYDDRAVLRDALAEIERLDAKCKKFHTAIEDKDVQALLADSENLDAALAELDQARAEIERLRVDAERYRWIKSLNFITADRDDKFVLICSATLLDERIDAAMREEAHDPDVQR